MQQIINKAVDQYRDLILAAERQIWSTLSKRSIFKISYCIHKMVYYALIKTMIQK